MRLGVYIVGVLLLLVPEILRVYWIMPFPGSQSNIATNDHQVEIAYWLHKNIWWFRMIGMLFVFISLAILLRKASGAGRVMLLIPVLLCMAVFYAFNFKFMADKMFLMPEQQIYGMVTPEDRSSNALVLAVVQGNEARAYPIELIGYHHQVRDTIGGSPILVTYCTVCRTGRVWDPMVGGEAEELRLVGMDHYNALFEDSRTGSWWRQATGECIVGPLKGERLAEVESQQMTVSEFASRHPHGTIMQPDPGATAKYAALEGFDEGDIDSSLERRDTASWMPKSWVLGVINNGDMRAYDWNELQRRKEIVDMLGGDSIRIHLAADQRSFDVVKMAGDELRPIRAYQEFWHSWRTFQPATSTFP